ncbi:MAG: TonB-dependent receptor domain-containing protein [Chthoniobacterales bacterium]
MKKSFSIRSIGNSLGIAIILLLCENSYGQALTPPGLTSREPAPPGAGPAGEATTERVIVTGSYIPTAETEAALPVTVYTAEVLQKQGANTPVEGLRQLPSFVGAATTENDSNGGNGQGGVNLRGIGQQNVLVLINGRRAFLGQGLNTSADVNAIPISGLSRTEVLKDGASAVYGSDAVAGVVNFIMLNGPGEAPYVGAEIDLLYGNTTEHDAHVRQAYVRGGVVGMDGKVQIAASGEYYSRANLFSRDRFIATTGDTSNTPPDPFYPGSGGLGWGGLNNNSSNFAGHVTVTDNGQGGPVGDLVLIDPRTSQVTPASYRAFDAGSDPAQFNFRAYTPAIPAVEKALYYVTGRYKIFSEALQLYGDIMYAKTKQDNGLAASPFFLDGTEINTSIFNPFGTNLESLRYRFVQESGLRRTFFDHDYYRYVAGLNGDFNFKDNSFISHFGYDTGFVYERFDELRIDAGDGTHTAIVDQINNNLFNPFIGQNAPIIGNAPTYINGVPTGMTAPYNNLLGFQNSEYLGHSYFYERDWLYDAKVNAHLFPTLWNGGVDLALGYEHRNVAEHSVPDPVQAAGDQLGFDQSPNTKTSQKVDSFFAELTVPIVTSTMNVPFVRSLELSFAYRYEKFKEKDQYTQRSSSFNNSNPDEDFGGSPRVSLRYQPIPDLTLRANWNQSFRGPTPTDLFNPVVQDFPVLFDPFAPGGPITLQPPQGVWRGGNTALKPETTDAYSAGLVYTPKWLSGFTVTVDYYQLFTTNLLLDGNSFSQVLVSQNVVDPDGFGNGSGAVGATGGPGLGVTRDANGNLIAVDSTIGNAGKRLVSGLDVTAVYQIPTTNWGQFTFTLGWNHFFTWKAEPGAGLGTHNFLGDFNTSIPLTPGGIPFNKAFLRGEWEWKGFDFVMTGNYIGDMEDDPSFIAGNFLVPQNPGTLEEPNWVLHRRITDYITLDMQLSYEFKKPEMQAAATGYSKDAKDAKSAVAGVETSSFWQRMLWGTKVTVGVNNAFDRQPPSVLAAFNDNYDTSNYSIRDRYWYVSLNKKF